MQLIFFFLNEFDGYFIVGLGHVLFKEDLAMQDLQPALDIFQSQPDITLVQLNKILLRDPSAIVMKTDKEFVTAGILRQMNEARITVFENIIHQLLDHPEYDEFILGLQPLPVIMKPAAGIHTSRPAYLLKEIVDGGFQSEVLQGRGHQAVRDIPDKLYRVVDDLLGVVDALELSGLVEIYQVFVEIKAGRRQQGTGIIMQVGSDPLPLLFLQTDRCVEKKFLLILLHPLQLKLVTDHLPLVKDDKDDQPNSKR